MQGSKYRYKHDGKIITAECYYYMSDDRPAYMVFWQRQKKHKGFPSIQRVAPGCFRLDGLDRDFRSLKDAVRIAYELARVSP